jgi:hypothetical protein
VTNTYDRPLMTPRTQQLHEDSHERNECDRIGDGQAKLLGWIVDEKSKIGRLVRVSVLKTNRENFMNFSRDFEWHS